MGFSKRKGTKGVKHLPDDFDEIQSKFIERINENVVKYKIPDALVINWDQTGVNLVPCGEWTMNETGAKQVPIKGVDDKRQIIALLAVAKSGDILPPQLLYQGLSDKCHPVHKFPDDWDIFHSENHWSNADTMRRYVERVIVPYVDKIKEELDLPLKQKALCVFDVFKAHQDKGLLKLLEENDIKVVFVPAACTDRLQPLDIQINGKFKSLMKSEFQTYYANEVKIALEKGTDITEIDVDLRLSKIKPIHAKWIVKCIDKLAHERELIATAFSKAGM
ncbi:hypothetical protein FSP39_017476 [Pinctada imbricata]|uniref:DDE-1 domain-containing protein n=1 Tax=Pinctada imbricata TaxID=66713 RepID=A0AA88Y531_PINIB|nr:hypothetical protein FSP39_017476 [Pinctada imbricata]